MTTGSDYKNDFVMVRLAVTAYMSPDDIRKQELVCSNDPHQDPLPPGWKVLPGSYINNNAYGGNQASRGQDGALNLAKPSQDGFGAIAFVNPETKQIVIGFRGSEWEKGVPLGMAGMAAAGLTQVVNHQPTNVNTKPMDGVALAAVTKAGAIDWAGPDRAFANPTRDWDPQFADALGYAQGILALTKPGGPYAGYTISVTGHSLGGGLAELTAQMYGFDGRTFDAPPLGNVGVAGEFADWAKRHGLPPKGAGVGDDFTNYFVNGSILRYAGMEYPGKAVNITGLPANHLGTDHGHSPSLVERHDRWRILDIFDKAARTGTLDRLGQDPDAPQASPLAAQDPRNPQHPDFSAYQRLTGAVENLGRWTGPETESIAATLYAAYKANPAMRNIDDVVMSNSSKAPDRVFAVYASASGLSESVSINAQDAVRRRPEEVLAGIATAPPSALDKTPVAETDVLSAVRRTA